MTRRWWIFGGAAAIAFLLYAPTIGYDFVWDDMHLIRNNPFLVQANPVQVFLRDFWYNPEIPENPGDMSYYRPLTGLSFLLERKEFELSPSGYHLTNVLLHSLVVLMVCLVTGQALRWREPAVEPSPWLAGAAGLLFGIHPALNCIPAFISGRTYLLGGLLLLVSLYALLQGGRPGRNRSVWLGLFGLGFLLALLALEAALVYTVIASGWILLNRRQYRPVWLWLGIGALALAIYFVLRFPVAHSALDSSVVRWARNQPLRVLNTFGQQSWQLLFPFAQRVIYTLGPAFTDLSGYTVLGILFLAAPLVLVIWQRSRIAALGYAWLVLFLLPFAHLLFLGPAGRMLYLSAPGGMILGAVLLARPGRVSASVGSAPAGPAHQRTSHQQRTGKPRAPVHQPTGAPVPWCSGALSLSGAPVLSVGARAWSLRSELALGLLLVYALACAVQLVRRNPIWRNEFSLYQAMVREAPDSPGAHLNFGNSLQAAGRMSEAIEHFQRATELSPDYVPPHNKLAFLLVEQEMLPEAIAEFGQVVRLMPSSADAHNNLALTLKKAGLLDSAIAEYRVALRLDPNSDKTLNNLGTALMARGEFGPAIDAFKLILSRNPSFEAARANLAQAYAEAGHPDSAENVLRQ